jgi:putative FmdB family regulatory protein
VSAVRKGDVLPIYVYRSTEEGCEKCSEGWEELQAADAAPIQKCPRCGAAVEKVPSVFSAGKGDVLSDSNLKDHGFQKLKRNEEGGYRREV